MGWFQTVRDGIYLALCAAFKVDPDSSAGLDRFVPAYVENTITPQAPKNLDVTYFSVESYQGESGLDYIMESQVVRDGKVKTRIEKSIPCSVLVTFYGPNADDDAEQFWSMFQWDNGAGSPRAILRGMQIAPVGTPVRPVSLYEVEDTYQRRRSDVRVNLVYLEISEYDSSEVDTPPEVTIQANN
jgi:hypothetical protein